MTFDLNRARAHLLSFNLRKLFIEEMGWDNPGADLGATYDHHKLQMKAVAQKRGFMVYSCTPPEGMEMPDYAARRKIETQVRKSAHEHLVIFCSADHARQVWQWVRREPGRPTTSREFELGTGQSGQALLERIRSMAIALEEEEGLGIVGVTGRVRAAFDVERVTRRFYDRFKEEHAALVKFLQGIPDEGMQRWYASVTLNRLMFIYFIQKKLFLDSDEHYLRNHLEKSRQNGDDHFYRDFLCPLFFEGFARREEERSAETRQMLGKIPYLNGSIFQRNQVEQAHGRHIQIADAAFERIFAFFDQYRWHLDERPLRDDREINPDVLGYIFEKYINQKEMGAYYTKEDITGYISRSTVLPYLLDQARKECSIAFDGQNAVWRALESDPGRYIFPAVKKGVDLPLPEEIEAGVKDVTRREGWNRTAPEEYALPTETWREVAARRARWEDTWLKLTCGEVREVNDLITLNLDIQQFTQDVIEDCEGPELLRAFWKALRGIKVLDPTCGSGAFLFAALNILEPLYEACLERMRIFVTELEQSGQKHRPEKFGDFKEMLAQADRHPNLRYFILKSIIVNNLYGVDIMDEAVEICKLRLFLKLAAQVERVEDVEPLPDIDFNIRAGNTLVGFTSLDDVRQAMMNEGGQMRMLWPEEEAQLARIEEEAELADKAFEHFQRAQVEEGDVTEADKAALGRRLETLNAELNRALVKTYGLEPDELEFSSWLDNHKPFHWLVDFYGIMRRGGFNVIIGNPPYVEISQVEYKICGLNLTNTGNLYSVCIERFTDLSSNYGRFGVIIPISAVSTPRMLPLMKLLTAQFTPLFVSNFAVRPGKLFVGTDMNLSILVGKKRTALLENHELWTTQYIRWFEKERPFLFQSLSFIKSKLIESFKTIPKTGDEISSQLMNNVQRYSSVAKFRMIGSNSESIYYHSGGRYFRKCLREKLSNEYKEFKVKKGYGAALLCLMNSSFYYWLWILISDCYHVTLRDVDAIPSSESFLQDPQFNVLANSLIDDLYKNAVIRKRNRQDGRIINEYNFAVGKSKPIIDIIDQALAKYLSLTEQELDYIINYDIKYRMGADDGEED